MKVKFNKLLLGLLFLAIGIMIIYLVINCCKENSILEGMEQNSIPNTLSCSDTYPLLLVKKENSKDTLSLCPNNFIKLDEFENCSDTENIINSIPSNSKQVVTINSISYEFLGFSTIRGCWPKVYNTSELLDKKYGIEQGIQRLDAYRALNFDDVLFTKKPTSTNNNINNNNNNNSINNKNNSSNKSSNNNINSISPNNPIADAGSGTLYNSVNNNIDNNIDNNIFNNMLNSANKDYYFNKTQDLNQIQDLNSIFPQQQDNLYMLKSEVVPPVCPACPNVEVTESLLKQKCPPCPPCARCPEPNFDCKKVPNYSLGSQNSFLPMPILNDFSTFGS
jgi:hypothetical protein